MSRELSIHAGQIHYLVKLGAFGSFGNDAVYFRLIFSEAGATMRMRIATLVVRTNPALPVEGPARRFIRLLVV